MRQIWPDLHVCEGAEDGELSRTVFHGLLRDIYYCRDFVHVRKEAEGGQLEAGFSWTRFRLHTRHGEPHMCAHCDFPCTNDLRFK